MIRIAAAFWCLSFLCSVNAQNSGLSDRLIALSHLEGDDYVTSRTILEKEAKENREPFAQIAEFTNEWRSALTAQIILDRIDGAEELTNLAQWRIAYHRKIVFMDRIEAPGYVLLRRFWEHPMLLVECYWKGNEIGAVPDPPLKMSVCVSCALGKLRIPQARKVYEDALGGKIDFAWDGGLDEISKNTSRRILVMATADALGRIGSPESVPVLLETMIHQPQKDDFVYIRIVRAIYMCMDKSSIPILKDFLAKSKSERLSSFFESFIKEIEDGKPAMSDFPYEDEATIREKVFSPDL